ncbi:hypothetical protein PROFUN_08246 [Planoprotostelium fungivorum]|uniref:Uncharacterized protein n=1 Tax=Planoprotostelium fungivorum TaxID=1890364 RepID=A0A2P6NKA4_9EUKA|nr:hypothetical protein PROFUN_08246 [Planoprotostelium fungivorum]
MHTWISRLNPQYLADWRAERTNSLGYFRILEASHSLPNNTHKRGKPKGAQAKITMKSEVRSSRREQSEGHLKARKALLRLKKRQKLITLECSALEAKWFQRMGAEFVLSKQLMEDEMY